MRSVILLPRLDDGDIFLCPEECSHFVPVNIFEEKHGNVRRLAADACTGTWPRMVANRTNDPDGLCQQVHSTETLLEIGQWHSFCPALFPQK